MIRKQYMSSYKIKIHVVIKTKIDWIYDPNCFHIKHEKTKHFFIILQILITNTYKVRFIRKSFYLMSNEIFFSHVINNTLLFYIILYISTNMDLLNFE